ncbi:hypothetical protein HK098_005490 [Nowakowskiella sp. JEL0407]|nr:hypothetical protein HK098_005490 [Nowakowskiella sp. JEL0407]
MASVSQYAIPPIEAPIPDSDIDDFITLGRNAVEPASILASHFSQTNIDMVKFDIDQFITIGAKTKSMDLNSTPDNEKTRRKSLFDVALKLVSKRDLVVADDGDLVKNVAVDVFGSQDIDMVLDNISQLPTDDLEPITMEVENKKMDRDVAPNEQIMNYRESKEEDPNSIDIQNLMYIGDAKQDQNPTFSEEDIKYLSNDFEQYVQIGVTDPEPQQSSRNSKVAASMEAIVPIVTTTIRKVFKSLEALSSFDKGDKKERKRVKSYDELSSMVKRDARFSEENEMKRAAVDFDTLVNNAKTLSKDILNHSMFIVKVWKHRRFLKICIT